MGKGPFAITGEGHEAPQVGTAYALKPGQDWVAAVLPGHRRRAHDRPDAARPAPRAPFARRGHQQRRPQHAVALQRPEAEDRLRLGAGGDAACRTPPASPWHRSCAGSTRSRRSSSARAAPAWATVHEAMNFAGIHKLPVIFVMREQPVRDLRPLAEAVRGRGRLRPGGGLRLSRRHRRRQRRRSPSTPRRRKPSSAPAKAKARRSSRPRPTASSRTPATTTTAATAHAKKSRSGRRRTRCSVTSTWLEEHDVAGPSKS